MDLFKRVLIPNYYCDRFILASQINSHKTRNSSFFLSFPFSPSYLIPCLTNIGKFSLWFQRYKFFNSVSREIQNSEGFDLCLVAP